MPIRRHFSGFTVPAFSVQVVFLVGLIALGYGIWKKNPLPSFVYVHPSTLQEPIQKPTSKKVFRINVKDIEYTVRPMAEYEISGVVVSRYDTSTWWGYMHRELMDHLNVVDLCVVWGANLVSDNFTQLNYSSGQFTCNVGTKSDAVWNAFDPNSLSNNHVLTDDPRLRKLLRSANPGDQINLKGILAEYSHKQGQGMNRGTSLVRDDRGNGACETIYVQSVIILKRAAPWPQQLRWLGAILIALSTFAWFFLTKIEE
jgi:hypothetical protein